MSLKALLTRKVRVRERRVTEMDADIAELREKVAEAEKTYAAFKKREKKPKR